MATDNPVPVSERTAGKLVILRGVLEVNYFDKFFTSHTEGKDPCKLDDGTVAYRILGYADTAAEAQIFLYGRAYC